MKADTGQHFNGVPKKEPDESLSISRRLALSKSTYGGSFMAKVISAGGTKQGADTEARHGIAFHVQKANHSSVRNCFLD